MNRWVAVALAGGFVGSLGLGDAFASDPPDMVRLKNGGMIRGTIQEYVPGDHLVITLPSGEVRRIPGAEVAEAGPAAAQASFPAAAPVAAAAPAPAPAAPPQQRVIATVPDDRAQVRLQHGGEEPVTFHVRTGTLTGTVSGSWGRTITTDAYEQICTTPCTATLQKGSHKLALSQSDGKPVGSDGLVTVRGPATLNGTYESYAGMRTAGFLMLVGGAVVAVAAPFVAMNDCDVTRNPECDSMDIGVLVGMGLGGTVVMLASIPFIAKRDEATITVQPGVAGARSPRNVAQEPSPRGTPLGLTGSIRF